MELHDESKDDTDQNETDPRQQWDRLLPPLKPSIITHPITGPITGLTKVLEVTTDEYTNLQPTTPLGNAIFTIGSECIVTGRKPYRSPYRQKLPGIEHTGFGLRPMNRPVLPSLRSPYNPFSFNLASQKNLTSPDMAQQASNESSYYSNPESSEKRRDKHGSYKQQAQIKTYYQASRPIHQFNYELTKAAESILRENAHGSDSTPADIYTQAYESVKAEWMARKIWNRKWGILPGMGWPHEEVASQSQDPGDRDQEDSDDDIENTKSRSNTILSELRVPRARFERMTISEDEPQWLHRRRPRK